MLGDCQRCRQGPGPSSPMKDLPGKTHGRPVKGFRPGSNVTRLVFGKDPFGYDVDNGSEAARVEAKRQVRSLHKNPSRDHGGLDHGGKISRTWTMS